MKKLNFLKAIIDILWIISMPLIPFIILFIGFIIFMDGYEFFPITMNGLRIEAFDMPTKIIMILMLASYLILINCLYLFQRVLRQFKKMKIFDSLVVRNFKKIGNLLIVASILNGVPAFIYVLLYQDKFELRLGLSPFLLTLAVGLFFLVLSEAFKISQSVKQENDLTI